MNKMENEILSEELTKIVVCDICGKILQNIYTSKMLNGNKINKDGSMSILNKERTVKIKDIYPSPSLKKYGFSIIDENNSVIEYRGNNKLCKDCFDNKKNYLIENSSSLLKQEKEKHELEIIKQKEIEKNKYKNNFFKCELLDIKEYVVKIKICTDWIYILLDDGTTHSIKTDSINNYSTNSEIYDETGEDEEND
jgi:hypothetical protein